MSHPAIERIRTYFDAFHRDDSEGYAACWLYPACYWSGGSWSVIPTPADMARNNAAYAKAQRAAGMSGGKIVSLECEPLGVDAALVKGTFTRTATDGTLIATVQAAYTVVRVDAAWKVAVCVTQSA